MIEFEDSNGIYIEKTIRRDGILVFQVFAKECTIAKFVKGDIMQIGDDVYTIQALPLRWSDLLNLYNPRFHYRLRIRLRPTELTDL